jgi:hypothetical protein
MIRVCAVLCLAVMSIGCGSSVQINHDFDPDADFTRYQTYAWAPQSANVLGNTQDPRERNTLLDKRIKDAVNAQLGREGLRLREDNPDLYVAYHTGVENKLDVTDWGYSYGSYYYGYPRRDITVYQYQTGTLIVDLIDVAAEELVWRGSAEATLKEDPSPEYMQKRIEQAVGMMFQKYPPKK